MHQSFFESVGSPIAFSHGSFLKKKYFAAACPLKLIALMLA